MNVSRKSPVARPIKWRKGYWRSKSIDEQAQALNEFLEQSGVSKQPLAYMIRILKLEIIDVLWDVVQHHDPIDRLTFWLGKKHHDIAEELIEEMAELGFIKINEKQEPQFDQDACLIVIRSKLLFWITQAADILRQGDIDGGAP